MRPWNVILLLISVRIVRSWIRNVKDPDKDILVDFQTRPYTSFDIIHRMYSLATISGQD